MLAGGADAGVGVDAGDCSAASDMLERVAW